MFAQTNGLIPGHLVRGSSSTPETSEFNSLEQQGNITQTLLCTHDGILLTQATADFITEINTSGSLNLFENLSSATINKFGIEWIPNENYFIEESHEDQWALVDTISKRHRTISESRVFNQSSSSIAPASQKTRSFRTNIRDLYSIEVYANGKSETMRFIKISDRKIHSEYYFQNGNSDIFIKSLQQFHIVDSVNSNNRKGQKEFLVLNAEVQKLKKTFAELNIDDIKGSSVSSSSWLPNKLVDMLVKFPEYVAPHNKVIRSPRSPLKSDEYEVLEEELENSNRYEKGDSEKIHHGNSKEKIIDDSYLPERKLVHRGSPLNEKQWREFQTEDGRISDPTRIKEAIFRGGIENQLRCEVWKYLLNYFKWDQNTIERIEYRRKKSEEYYQMKAQWLSMSSTQERNFSGYRDRKCQIEKDVKRTDRTQEFFAGEENPNIALLQDILMTYVMYNFDLGYVQGMSDLLAPMLFIQKNEVDSFWCFVGFMDLVFSNFDIDQAGMKQQLSQLNTLLNYCNPKLFNYFQENDSDNMYFCFRWLLVWFKREFSNDDIMKLWECLWTKLPCDNFHLLISIAILDQEASTIIGNEFKFNEILKCVNELSMKINLNKTLELSESIYHQIIESKMLTNNLRKIIGEELDPNEISVSTNDTDDDFDDLVREPTPEENSLRLQKLDEACEMSTFLSFY